MRLRLFDSLGKEPAGARGRHAFPPVGCARRRCRPMAAPELPLLPIWRSPSQHCSLVGRPLTYFWSINPERTAARALTFAQLAVMVWLIWDSCRTAARQTWLLRAYVAGAAVASLLTITRYARASRLLPALRRRRIRPQRSGAHRGAVDSSGALSFASGAGLGALGFEGLRRRGDGGRAALASRTSLVVSFPFFHLCGVDLAGVGPGQRLAGIAWRACWRRARCNWPPPLPAKGWRPSPGGSQGTLHDRTRIWKAGLKSFQRHPSWGGSRRLSRGGAPQLGTPARAGHQYVAHSTWLSFWSSAA